MPTREQLQRDRAPDDAPDPEQEDTERAADVERDVADAEAQEQRQ